MALERFGNFEAAFSTKISHSLPWVVFKRPPFLFSLLQVNNSSMFILFFFIIVLYGSPINSNKILPRDADSVLIWINTRDTSSEVCDHTRTTYDIVWSCAVTLFACVWTAIHPNLSGPLDSGWKVIRRRITTAICALIAPELLALWALRQYSSAEHIAETYNSIFVPGAAHIVQPQREHSHFKLQRVLERVASGPQSMYKGMHNWFSDMEVEHVKRKNPQPWTKTHGFFVQMGGFMLYNGEVPERVLIFEDMCRMISANEIDNPTVTEAEIQDRSKGNTLSKAIIVLQTLWFVVQCLARVVSGLPLSELEVVTLGFAVLNGIIYAVWWDKPQDVDIAIYIPRLANGTQLTTTSGDTPRNNQLEDIISSYLWKPLWKLYKNDNTQKESCRVPMFNFTQPADNSDQYTACIIGTIFGGFHFFGWASAFPSRAEQLIWHVSVPIITVVPLLILLVQVLDHCRTEADSTRVVQQFLKALLETLLHALTILGMVVYILARIALLVVAFISLRALPPEAFVQIRWTSFIPHF